MKQMNVGNMSNTDLYLFLSHLLNHLKFIANIKNAVRENSDSLRYTPLFLKLTKIIINISIINAKFVLILLLLADPVVTNQKYIIGDPGFSSQKQQLAQLLEILMRKYLPEKYPHAHKIRLPFSPSRKMFDPTAIVDCFAHLASGSIEETVRDEIVSLYAKDLRSVLTSLSYLLRSAQTHGTDLTYFNSIDTLYNNISTFKKKNTHNHLFLLSDSAKEVYRLALRLSREPEINHFARNTNNAPAVPLLVHGGIRFAPRSGSTVRKPSPTAATTPKTTPKSVEKPQTGSKSVTITFLDQSNTNFKIQLVLDRQNYKMIEKDVSVTLDNYRSENVKFNLLSLLSVGSYQYEGSGIIRLPKHSGVVEADVYKLSRKRKEYVEKIKFKIEYDSESRTTPAKTTTKSEQVVDIVIEKFEYLNSKIKINRSEKIVNVFVDGKDIGNVAVGNKLENIFDYEEVPGSFKIKFALIIDENVGSAASTIRNLSFTNRYSIQVKSIGTLYFSFKKRNETRLIQTPSRGTRSIQPPLTIKPSSTPLTKQDSSEKYKFIPLDKRSLPINSSGNFTVMFSLQEIFINKDLWSNKQKVKAKFTIRDTIQRFELFKDNKSYDLQRKTSLGDDKFVFHLTNPIIISAQILLDVTITGSDGRGRSQNFYTNVFQLEANGEMNVYREIHLSLIQNKFPLGHIQFNYISINNNIKKNSLDNFLVSLKKINLNEDSFTVIKRNKRLLKLYLSVNNKNLITENFKPVTEKTFNNISLQSSAHDLIDKTVYAKLYEFLPGGNEVQLLEGKLQLVFFKDYSPISYQVPLTLVTTKLGTQFGSFEFDISPAPMKYEPANLVRNSEKTESKPAHSLKSWVKSNNSTQYYLKSKNPKDTPTKTTPQFVEVTNETESDTGNNLFKTAPTSFKESSTSPLINISDVSTNVPIHLNQSAKINARPLSASLMNSFTILNNTPSKTEPNVSKFKDNPKLTDSVYDIPVKNTKAASYNPNTTTVTPSDDSKTNKENTAIKNKITTIKLLQSIQRGQPHIVDGYHLIKIEIISLEFPASFPIIQNLNLYDIYKNVIDGKQIFTINIKKSYVITREYKLLKPVKTVTNESCIFYVYLKKIDNNFEFILGSNDSLRNQNYYDNLENLKLLSLIVKFNKFNIVLTQEFKNASKTISLTFKAEHITLSRLPEKLKPLPMMAEIKIKLVKINNLPKLGNIKVLLNQSYARYSDEDTVNYRYYYFGTFNVVNQSEIIINTEYNISIDTNSISQYMLFKKFQIFYGTEDQPTLESRTDLVIIPGQKKDNISIELVNLTEAQNTEATILFDISPAT